MDKPKALRLADALERGWLENVDSAAVDVTMIQEELRRLYEARERLHEMAGQRLRRIEKIEAMKQELVEALTSIAEYWNQDTNQQAMEDACHYMTDTAQAILAKHKEQE